MAVGELCWANLAGGQEDFEVGKVRVSMVRKGSLPMYVSLWVEEMCFPVLIEDEDAADLESGSSWCLSWADSRGGMAEKVQKVKDDDVNDEVSDNSNFKSPPIWRRVASEDSGWRLGHREACG